MKVLIACEESQAVTKQFRKLGHEAYSCDILECSGSHPEWHIQGDAGEIITLYWDLIIAFPPCTYMSNAGALRMYPEKGVVDRERYKKAMQAKDFFMLFYNSNCKKIAIENPVPLNLVELPVKTQIIHPYFFGDPFSKKTCLWLNGLPKLRPTNMLKEYQPFINGGGGRTNKNNYKNKKVPFANGSTKRSKTFEGIAEAMAVQWSKESFGNDAVHRFYPMNQLKLF